MNKMGYFVYQVNRELRSTSTYKGEADAVSFLYDREGNRKYLTREERRAFIAVAKRAAPDVRSFCLVLAYTGARISEVLALTPGRFDFTACMVIIETLKRRRRGMFRAIPLPPDIFDGRERGDRICGLRLDTLSPEVPIWDWCRTTAWNHVKECMQLAGIRGKRASPKALRHAFAVSALEADIPITLVGRWLGHARLTTTEIYANVVGREEQRIAQRLWDSF